MKGVDTEYLVEIVRQIRCKNNGIRVHINKKGFSGLHGVMINDTHLSFEYLHEKSIMIDRLLDTILCDILVKSRIFRKLNN